MAIQKKSTKPAGITNESGEPEIVLAIGDKIFAMHPPKAAAALEEAALEEADSDDEADQP